MKIYVPLNFLQSQIRIKIIKFGKTQLTFLSVKLKPWISMIPVKLMIWNLEFIINLKLWYNLCNLSHSCFSKFSIVSILSGEARQISVYQTVSGVLSCRDHATYPTPYCNKLSQLKLFRHAIPCCFWTYPTPYCNKLSQLKLFRHAIPCCDDFHQLLHARCMVKDLIDPTFDELQNNVTEHTCGGIGIWWLTEIQKSMVQPCSCE